MLQTKPKPCKFCGKETHASWKCFSKPTRAMKPEATKTTTKRQKTNREWFNVNLPDDKGLWYCYLFIAPECPRWLSRSTITLEHVRSKARAPELMYQISNLKPACSFCNEIKGSLDLKDLAKVYPHIRDIM
jgi:5-methylcytosine-specific restriction endonuclease McrA